MRVTEQDGVQVVELTGRIDVTSSPELEKLLDSLLDSGKKRIICDFSRNEYVSSVGLRVFLSALKRTVKAGGYLVLSSLKPGIREIFDMTGLAGLFTIYDSAEAALADFREASHKSKLKDGKKYGEIEEVIIDRQPKAVTLAYSAKPERGRMDEKV